VLKYPSYNVEIFTQWKFWKISMWSQENFMKFTITNNDVNSVRRDTVVWLLRAPLLLLGLLQEWYYSIIVAAYSFGTLRRATTCVRSQRIKGRDIYYSLPSLHHHHHHHGAKRSAVASRRWDLQPKRSVLSQLKSISHGYLVTGNPEQQRFAIQSGVLTSTSSRRRGAFNGRPLPERADLGPESQTH